MRTKRKRREREREGERGGGGGVGGGGGWRRGAPKENTLLMYHTSMLLSSPSIPQTCVVMKAVSQETSQGGGVNTLPLN